MTSSGTSNCLAAICLASCLAVTGSTALRGSLMSPSIVMFYGGELPAPVYMVNMSDISTFLMSLEKTDITSTEVQKALTGKHLKVSLFWGARWARFVREGRRFSELRPEDAGHHARLFPQQGDRPTLFVQTQPMMWEDASRQVPTDNASFAEAARVPDSSRALLVRYGLLVAPPPRAQ